MPYMILTFDKPGHEHVRDATRAQHLEYLEANVDKLVAGGGLLTDAADSVIGGLILLDVDTAEEAQAFIASDPFTATGMFERVEVVRWRPSFFDFKRLAPGTVLKP